MRDTYIEAALGEVINTEVTTTVTSAPSGNDHNSSLSNQFSYTVFDLKNFAVTCADCLISGRQLLVRCWISQG